MDREEEMINLVSNLTKIIGALQSSIKDLTDSGFLLKERIENLEARVNKIF